LEKVAEVSNVLLNAGNIVITTSDDLGHRDLNIINPLIGAQDTKLVWVGEMDDHNMPIDLHIEENETTESMYLQVKKMLVDAKAVLL